MYIFLKKSIILCLSLFIIISLPQLSITFSMRFSNNIKDFILLSFFYKNNASPFLLMLYYNANVLLSSLLYISSLSLLILISFQKRFIKRYFPLFTLLLLTIYFCLGMLSLRGIYEGYFGFIICIVSVCSLKYYYNFLNLKLIGNKK